MRPAGGASVALGLPIGLLEQFLGGASTSSASGGPRNAVDRVVKGARMHE